MKSPPQGRLDRLGIFAAGIYLFLVGVAVALGAFGGNSGSMGFEWIPLIMLSLPWRNLGSAQEFVIPGLIANLFLLYFLGIFVEMVRREKPKE